jgi:hypothetical protein
MVDISPTMSPPVRTASSVPVDFSSGVEITFTQPDISRCTLRASSPSRIMTSRGSYRANRPAEKHVRAVSAEIRDRNARLGQSFR